MSLPYTYKSFYETDISVQKFFIKLKKLKESEHIDDIFFDKSVFKLDFKPQLFGLKNTVVIKFKKDSSGFDYEFSLENIVKVSIIIISISAFLYKDLINLIIFITIVIFSLYFIVIFHTKNFLENIFNKITKDVFIPEKMGKEQLSWQNNPDKCPGCGADLTIYDSFCPECGLNLKNRRKTKKQPVSRTGFPDYKILYKFYKDKE